MFYDLCARSVHVICKLPKVVKVSLGFAMVIISPSMNDSNLQLITREKFEVFVYKLSTFKSSSGPPWFRSLYLGEGSYGFVYLATNNGDVEDVDLPFKMAIKCAPVTSSSSLIYEEHIIIDFSCPYVIS